MGTPGSSLGAFRKGAVGGVAPHGLKITSFRKYDGFFEERIKRKKRKREEKQKGVQYEDFPGGHPF